jgi:hypothetical protein
VSIQVVMTLTNGQVIQGLNYRMAPYGPFGPSVPASPSPFAGGVYHLQTPLGWVDIVASQVKSMAITSGVQQ